jgi:chemotaxis protein methyltransferase WspC
VYDTIYQILQRRIGLMPESIGPKAIGRAIEQCMAERQLRNPDDYRRLLESQPEILQELIEAVIVPETWFMRDRAPFDFLKAQVQQGTILSRQRPLRILSFPCSTGEEPYSIAICLLEAGLDPSQFSVEGIDISHQSLGRARAARYGNYSFRSQPTEIRDRYFVPSGSGYQLQPQVIQQVTFRQGNILDPDLLSALRPYQVIFCRNLLIYLDNDSRRRVFANLSKGLSADGLLFLGSTESTQPVALPLRPVRYEGTLFYTKSSEIKSSEIKSSEIKSSKPQSAPVEATPIDRSPQRSPSLTTATPVGQGRRTVPAPIAAPRPLASPFPQRIAPTGPPIAARIDPLPAARPARVPPATLNPELVGLRQLADAGLLSEAIESCEYYLRGHSNDAEGHCLLGELYQAQQLDRQAEQCYRRATYLDPQHRQALVHLALLKEQQGDRAGANLFWRRVDRLGEQGP